MNAPETTQPDNTPAMANDDAGVPGDVGPLNASRDDGAPADLTGGHLAGVGGYSDVANGERFIGDHGDNLRFVATGNRWLVWNERRWVPDELSRSLTLAIKTAKKTVALAGSEDRRAAQRVRAVEVTATTVAGAASLVAARDDREAASRALASARGLLQVTRMKNMITAATAMGLGITEGQLNGKPTSVEDALPGTCRVRRPLAFRPHSPDMSKALVLSNRLRGRCSWPSVQSRDHPVRQLVWSACRAHRGWLQRT